MDERIDILDKDGLPTGEVRWKSEAHALGLWHRTFHCWISGSDDEGPYLLVQRRAAVKDLWPGYLDVTAAGHLAAGEETLDGLREVEEELGLNVNPDRLIRLGTRRAEGRIPQGLDREFQEVFLLLDSTPPRELRLQREEVAAVLRIGLDGAEALGCKGEVAALAYANGERRPASIRLSDFVPSDDGYLASVARVARRTLAGERPGTIF